MIFIILAVGLSAAIVEAYLDRHGETKEGKYQQSLVLFALICVVALVVCWAYEVNPLKTAALFLSVRVLVFDPLVNYFLKKYSEGHKDINIWTYVGTTSKIDRLVSKIDWRVRLGVRILIFAVALFWFLSTL